MNSRFVVAFPPGESRPKRGLTGTGKHRAGNLPKPVTERIARPMLKPSHREAILEGGMKVMFRLGYQGASVRDICAAAGVPQGSFTNHFRSKEAFAEEVLNRYFARTQAVVQEALDDKSLTPRQRLKRYLDLISDILEDAKWDRGCLIGDFSLETTSQSKLLRERLEAICQ